MASTSLALEISFTDGTTRSVPVLLVTQVAAERHFKMGMGKMLEEMRMEVFAWLAWDAIHVSGDTVPPFDDWLKLAADVSPVEEPTPT